MPSEKRSAEPSPLRTMRDNKMIVILSHLICVTQKQTPGRVPYLPKLCCLLILLHISQSTLKPASLSSVLIHSTLVRVCLVSHQDYFINFLTLSLPLASFLPIHPPNQSQSSFQDTNLADSLLLKGLPVVCHHRVASQQCSVVQACPQPPDFNSAPWPGFWAWAHCCLCFPTLPVCHFSNFKTQFKGVWKAFPNSSMIHVTCLCLCGVNKFPYFPHTSVPKTIRYLWWELGSMTPLEALLFTGMRTHQKAGILPHKHRLPLANTGLVYTNLTFKVCVNIFIIQ